ncbi:C39 family peptidase [uncultured Azonexus sp.]|uniref:C39 family peptidase n=1 Tax=uncultured Azonexus sp. TaxID=520307 RepID=UPI002610B391|nr:C39 family peptidase [uncultured Azonexus sp.]
MNPIRSLLLLVLFSLLLPGRPLMAAPVRLALVVPGTMISKPVMSMRERRFEHIVEQKTDFSCGAAALATILRYAYGMNVSEPQVVSEMLAVADPELVRRLGFSLLDVKRYVESIGMRGRGYRISIEALNEVRVPVIVLLNYKGYKHFVVLRRISGNSVYLGDPAMGNRVIDREVFASGWNGVLFAVIGPQYNRETPLLRPRERLTVRDTESWRPISDVELVDFGFLRADFF